MPVLKHGDVLLLKAAQERRLPNSPMLELCPEAFVVVEDCETNELRLEPVSHDALKALAPAKHRALYDELRAARDASPIAPAKD